MPSGMPTDIQRLIKRMLEARTDKAEDVIPDMASGGILGLQDGGVMGEEDPLSSRQQMILDMMANQRREGRRENPSFIRRMQNKIIEMTGIRGLVGGQISVPIQSI